MENESRTVLKVKDETIRRLEKELAFVKDTYQGIREKYLNQQVMFPVHPSI